MVKTNCLIPFCTRQGKIFIENSTKKVILTLKIFQKKKAPVEINNVSELNQKEFDEDMSGADLDIPGSEFDDEFDDTGNEDEENGHYSIGGDNHNNLEENT